MWIAWNTAALWAVALVAAVLLVRRVRQPWVIAASAAARELALVLSLYALWQYVHGLTFRHVTGAETHGRWVWRVEQWLHLPSELWLQRQVLPHGWAVQFFNAYYAVAHGPSLMIALVWLFFRHRDRYPLVRNSLAVVTGLCLVIRLVPVAPPRLLPDLGFVDTGLLFHQSVYGTGTGGWSDQLAAMPSIHVAWALVVTLAALTASTSRWRWVAGAHLVLTVLAVTLTANHWLADGIVPALLLWPIVAVQRRGRGAGGPSPAEPDDASDRVPVDA
jgi:hypothetical protein